MNWWCVFSHIEKEKKNPSINIGLPTVFLFLTYFVRNLFVILSLGPTRVVEIDFFFT